MATHSPSGKTGLVKVAGHGIDSGHHMAEQAPGELTKALIPFLAPAP